MTEILIHTLKLRNTIPVPFMGMEGYRKPLLRYSLKKIRQSREFVNNFCGHFVSTAGEKSGFLDLILQWGPG